MTHAEAHETGSDTLSDETSTSTWIPIPATASNSTNIPELELSMVSTSKLTKTQTKASSTTFGVANKTAEPYSHFPYLHMTPAEQIKALPQFQKNNCTQILQMSKFPEKVHISNKGFVATVVDAYVSHHNLVIRPDDIWAAIMIQFSFYINKHAEEFRTQFVDFEGKKKKKLEISMPGSLESARYDTFVKLMSQEIDKNLVDPTVKNWVLPDFSTTTDNDLVTVGVVFMASMKKYFKYKVFFECGIPEITLEGTVEDWRNVYGRLEKLKEYKLEKWYNLLEPVIKQFVNAKEGNVDSRFWDQIVNYDPGCGWPSISGWITVFSSFYENGMWRGTKEQKYNIYY